MYPHFELLNVVQPPVELRPVSRGPVNEITTLPVSELSLRITASPDPLLVLRPATSMVVVHWPADAMFVSIESCQYPTRVNVCDGMCSACGADGAIFA